MISTKSQQQNLTWQEISPGRWERGVDNAERFYTTMAKIFEGSGRMFFAITGHVSLLRPVLKNESIEDIEARIDRAIRIAWLTLRHEQPGIASWVEWNSNRNELVKVYESLREDDNWLSNTCQFVTTERTSLEWCNSDPPAPNLATLFIIRSPILDEITEPKVRRSLVIRSPHDIMDGIGTLHILSALLRLTSEAFQLGARYITPAFGSEHTRLPPPLSIAASLPALQSSTSQSRLDTITARNKSITEGIELLTVPYNPKSQVPGKHQRIELKLSESTTSDLLSICKEAGITVTHAYHAAAAMTLRYLQPLTTKPETLRYINYGLVNLRKYCRPPFNSPSYGASVYHCVSADRLVIDFSIPGEQPKQDRKMKGGASMGSMGRSLIDIKERQRNEERKEFKRVLRCVSQFYNRIREDDELISLAPSVWSNATPEYPTTSPSSTTSTSLTKPVPPPDPTPSVSVSSMGIIDNIINRTPGQGIEVSDPWVMGEELGPGLGLFLESFKGQLCLSGAFNDAWHSAEEVGGFVRDVMRIVLEGLGV